MAPYNAEALVNGSTLLFEAQRYEESLKYFDRFDRLVQREQAAHNAHSLWLGIKLLTIQQDTRRTIAPGHRPEAQLPGFGGIPSVSGIPDRSQLTMHFENPIKRRVSRKIWVGNVPVGGDAPISIQTMTNTETCDVAATVAQIQRAQDAGADIVRVSVPTMEAAEAFGQIRKQVNVPLVADIHLITKLRCGWPSWASIVCVLTRATLVVKTACGPWLMPPAITVFRSVSA